MFLIRKCSSPCVCVCVCVSSLLTHCRLRILGHLSRLSEERLSKQLLLSAPVGGKRTAEGQKCQWSDLVATI